MGICIGVLHGSSIEYLMLIHLKASGTHGVTLHTPPKNDHFAMFFQKAGHKRPATPSTPSTPPAPPPAPPSGESQVAAAFTPLLATLLDRVLPPAHHSPGSSLRNVDIPSTYHVPSSDGPDEDINPYPDITSFLTSLEEKYPKRRLAEYIDVFESKDFYNINEIATLSVEQLKSAEFGLTMGNAQFLLEKVTKEMKAIDRQRRK
jgi:hypothetical protein